MNVSSFGVLIPQPILREGMITYLHQHFPDWYIAGYADLKALHQTRYDLRLLFVDGRLLDFNNTYRQPFAVLKCPANTAYVVMSDQTHSEYIQQVMQNGAHGYIYAQMDGLEEMLITATHEVLSGRIYLCPQSVAQLARHTPSLQRLRRRERQVLQHMAAGLSVKQMAQQLNVGEKTIYRDRERLRQWLDVPTVEQIVDAARQRGLL